MAISIPVVRSAFAYDTDEVSDQSGLLCEDESLTVQADADDTDINVIVRRFGMTGEIPQNVRVPLSEEFNDITDYHSALNQVIAAEKAFMSMPAEIRIRFDHDPAKLIQFVENPANREEAVKLGIVNAPPKVVTAPFGQASDPVASTA